MNEFALATKLEEVVTTSPLLEKPAESNPIEMYASRSDRFTNKAKQLVVDNYNAHYKNGNTRRLKLNDVYIVTFTKVMDSWTAYVASTKVRGLLYEVTHNGNRSESTINVYRKVNDVCIAD